MAFSLVGALSSSDTAALRDFAVAPGRDFIYLALDNGVRRLTYPGLADVPWKAGSSLISSPGGVTGVAVDPSTGNIWKVVHSFGDTFIIGHEPDGDELADSAFDSDDGWGGCAWNPVDGKLYVVHAGNGKLAEVDFGAGTLVVVEDPDATTTGTVTSATAPSVAGPGGWVWWVFHTTSLDWTSVYDPSNGFRLDQGADSEAHPGVGRCDGSLWNYDEDLIQQGRRLTYTPPASGGNAPNALMDPFNHPFASFNHAWGSYIVTPLDPIPGEQAGVYELACDGPRGWTVGNIGWGSGTATTGWDVGVNS